MKNIIIILLLLALFEQVLCQDDSAIYRIENNSKKYLFSYTAGAQYGFIFAHSDAVENTKGSNPFGIEMILSWQRNDAGIWNLCNCYPRKGLLFAYYNYDNAILGHGIVTSYFLEPVYRLNKNLFFSFKAAAGLAYLTNPYHPDHNPANQSYSAAINAYLLLGTGIWFRISDQWWFNTSVNYQHVSNGGLREPNKGINWPTAGFQLSFMPHPAPYYIGKISSEKYWKHQSPRWDLGLFGMARRGTNSNGENQRMPLVGLQLQGSKQVGRINALTYGLEVVADKKLSQQLKADSINASAVRASALIGHEFLLGKFIFSQRLGIYLFDQTPYFDLLFHCWGIGFRFSKHWGIGLNLKAHRQIAEYADIRLVYSFTK